MLWIAIPNQTKGHTMKINSLMIPDPITITENASIQEAIELMKINSIRHLPEDKAMLYKH